MLFVFCFTILLLVAVDVTNALWNTSTVKIHISTSRDGQALLVIDANITTNRLTLRPATREDLDFYVSLCAKPENMKFNGNGSTIPPDELRKYISGWEEKWANGSPFGAFVVQLRNENRTKIATVSCAEDDAPGQTKFSVFIDSAHWARGYGTELADAAINHWMPMLIALGQKVHGEEIRRVHASVILSNVASVKILGKMGLVRDEAMTKPRSVIWATEADEQQFEGHYYRNFTSFHSC